jgi:hypothetical protein
MDGFPYIMDLIVVKGRGGAKEEDTLKDFVRIGEIFSTAQVPICRMEQQITSKIISSLYAIAF